MEIDHIIDEMDEVEDAEDRESTYYVHPTEVYYP